MKNKRNVKTKLLEKTPLQKLFHNLRTFFMLTNRSVLLPYPFYQFLEFFRLLEFSMCLLLTDLPEVWDDNRPFRNIFHFAQIFWRFSADVDTKTGLTVSFIVIVVLFFILELTVLGIFINFMRTSVISEIASFIACLFQEIIFQLLFSWVGSQLGTLISLMATDSSYRGGFEIAQLVIYLIMLIYFAFFSFNFSNNGVSYMKGRSISWSYKTQRIYVFTTLLNLFLTRLVEMLPKAASLVFALITAIYVILYIVYLFILLPYIDMKTNSYHISLSISCLVGFLMQLISFHVHHIDASFMIIIVIILAIILVISINRINENRKKKSIDTLKAVSSNELLFEEAYKTKNSFLLSVRFGFETGNFYVFTWQPFLSAIEIWPNDRDIWIQWVRFVIIYPDQGRRLEQIINEFHEKGFKDWSTKYILSQVKFIQNSRNKHMTRDLKQELTSIDEEILNIKTIVITYWNEISGGSLNSNSTYNIASKLKQLLEKVNTQYLRLLSLYPNNYPIASKYSDFMLNIISDPVEGQFWENRSKVLKNKVQQVLTDATQEYGFAFFPFIPRSLQGLADGGNGGGGRDASVSDSQKHREHFNIPRPESSLLIPEEENEGENDQANKMNNNNKMANSAAVNEANDGNNQNLTESNNSNLPDDDEDISMAPSHFRKLGLNAKVPFITNLVIISIVFFIIAFICVPFVPPITIVAMLQPYRNQFKVLKSICDIRTSMMKEPYYMFFQALQPIIYAVVGGFNPYQNSTMNEELKRLDDMVQILQSYYGTSIKYNSNAGKYINQTTIKYSYKTTSIETSFLEGLNTITAAIMHHEDPFGQYFENDWFQFIFNNMDRMEASLGNLANIICNDMNEYRDNSIKTISIILYVFIGLEVILIPVFIVFVVQIRKNWNYIINTINSIPRVAIQKVIQRYSNESSKNIKNSDEHKNFKSEFRYQLSLVQMVSSRDTSGGIPMKTIIIIFLIDFILSIACVIAVVQIMDITKKDLTHVPMQYYTGTDGIYAIFKLISVFLIKGYIDYANNLTGTDQATFGTFDASYIHRGIYFIIMQMAGTLDQVIFGSTDYPQKGILFSTPEILELLTQVNGNPYGPNDTVTDLDLRLFPHFVGLELFYESNVKLVEKIISDANYSFFSIKSLIDGDIKSIFTSASLGTYSLVPLFLDVYIEKTEDLFNSSMDNINLILFMLGIGLFVLGILAIAWLNVMIMNVKKTVQFALSLLSMVDPIYVQEMQNVMNLFYGKTSGAVQTNQTLQRTFNEVESLVPERPLELNGQLLINSINDKLIEMWELDPEQIKGSHISLILTFNDKTVLNELTQQANGSSHPKQPRHYDTSITLNASKRVINVSFTSYYVPKSKETKLVLMFMSNLNPEEKGKNIDQIIQENNDIKIEAVPEAFRQKIDLQSDRTSFTSHYLVFNAIELLNFDEFASVHSAKETVSFFKKFEDKLKEMCNNSNIDATFLKKIGNTFIVGFNFIQQNTNYYKSAQDSYDFTKELNSFANANNYEMRSCSTFTKSATSMLLSKNTLKFDVYSDEIQSLLLMIKSSEKDKLLIPAKMRDFMPPNISSEAEEAEIIQYNKDSEWGYKFTTASSKLDIFTV